jgi:hypothetical protein
MKNAEFYADLKFVDVMERLDQGHLHRLPEHPETTHVSAWSGIEPGSGTF